MQCSHRQLRLNVYMNSLAIKQKNPASKAVKSIELNISRAHRVCVLRQIDSSSTNQSAIDCTHLDELSMPIWFVVPVHKSPTNGSQCYCQVNIYCIARTWRSRCFYAFDVPIQFVLCCNKSTAAFNVHHFRSFFFFVFTIFDCFQRNGNCYSLSRQISSTLKKSIWLFHSIKFAS